MGVAMKRRDALKIASNRSCWPAGPQPNRRRPNTGAPGDAGTQDHRREGDPHRTGGLRSGGSPRYSRVSLVYMVPAAPLHQERPYAVAAYLEQHLKPFVIGRNCDDIEDIWQSAYVQSYFRSGVTEK